MTIASAADQPGDPGRLAILLRTLEAYCSARIRLLETLDLAFSNRDSLAEFSEHLVKALLGGKLAESRVQNGYDLITPSDERIQVRYLANPGSAFQGTTPSAGARRTGRDCGPPGALERLSRFAGEAARLPSRQNRAMLIALLAVLGVDLITLAFVVAVLLSRRAGAFKGMIRVADGEVPGFAENGSVASAGG